MFFILSKVLSWVIMPVSLIVILYVSSWVFNKQSFSKWLKWFSLGLVLFFSNSYIAKLAMNAWEPAAKEYASFEDKQYECAIVLGGFTEPNRPPYDRIHFNKGADRLMHAVELYQKGIVKKILVSGGSGVLTFEGIPESHQIRSFIISLGIPTEDVWIDGQSKNTRENARNSKQILLNKGVNDEVILFTSAFHMKRARGCFDKLSIKLETFPTDYYGGPMRYSFDEFIIPSLYGLQVWTILIKEWAGLAAYKLAGYN